MTNLPTISNNPQSHAMSITKAPQGVSHPEGTGKPPTGSKLPAPRQGEGTASGGTPSRLAGGSSSASGSTANVSQTSNTADAKMASSQGAVAQPVEPFSALLARQMGEADLFTLDAAQTAIAIKGRITSEDAKPVPTITEAQDQATTTANTPIDPTNALAAMLLQLPQEIRTPITNDATSNAATSKTSNNKTAGIDIATLKAVTPGDSSVIKPDVTKLDVTKPGMAKPDMTKPEMANTSSSKIVASAVVPDKQILSVSLVQDEAKRAELPAGLAQTSQNITQAVTSPVVPAVISSVIPNVLNNNSTTTAPQSITTPIGSSGWADDFSQKISWMSTQRNQIAELHLNPPDLGPLNVVLKISDNQATALFTSPHSAVRDAVENALPRLRETLADNGITLGNTTVSDQPPQDRGREGNMNQGFGTAAQREISTEASIPTGLSAATAQIAPIRRHNGMVDTFA